MDSAMLTKILAGGLGMTYTMILAMTGKIDGPTAMSAVQTITGVFLGSVAFSSGAKAIAEGMKK